MTSSAPPQTASCDPRSKKPGIVRHTGVKCAVSKRRRVRFSDQKLQDMVGIKPPKLADEKDTVLGAAKRAEILGFVCLGILLTLRVR